ncbi:MAG: HNH endonuclease signature motif containing protein [Thermoanaerobaculia bacterium]
MRPVTKGNPPTYAYDTQAAEQAATKTFNANSATAIVYNVAVGAVVGPAITFTYEAIMDELLDKQVLANAYPNPSTPLNRARCKNRMRETLTDGDIVEQGYLAARPDLVAMLGEYCSFCELPIAGHLLAIEHRAPKELYPNYMIWWWNFLLACRDCNSAKGTLPPRATATGWSGVVAPTEQQLINAIIARYYWPDRDADSYRRFLPSYYRNTDGLAPVLLTSADASDRQNLRRSNTEDEVRADVFDAANGGLKLNRYVEVRIAYNGGAAAIGARSLALTGLDQNENARVAKRTLAWLGLCGRLNTLFNAIAAQASTANGRIVFDAQWPLILALAVARGFYSVWVEILTGYPFPANMTTGGLQADLGAQFVYDTNPANNVHADEVFAGTNYAQVP